MESIKMVKSLGVLLLKFANYLFHLCVITKYHLHVTTHHATYINYVHVYNNTQSWYERMHVRELCARWICIALCLTIVSFHCLSKTHLSGHWILVEKWDMLWSAANYCRCLPYSCYSRVHRYVRGGNWWRISRNTVTIEIGDLVVYLAIRLKSINSHIYMTISSPSLKRNHLLISISSSTAK